MATLPGMRERTVTINALSKTFAVTGWRVGWSISPPEVNDAVRKVHDFVTVGAPHPLQEAGAKSLGLPDDYFLSLRPFYQERRDLMERILRDAGFGPVRPQGAYYMMADFSGFGRGDDTEFSIWLAQEIGVAVVPGSSFYSNPADGRAWVRFCFCKRAETLAEAGRRLMKLRGHSRVV
jgi:aminotransferase